MEGFTLPFSQCIIDKKIAKKIKQTFVCHGQRLLKERKKEKV